MGRFAIVKKDAIALVNPWQIRFPGREIKGFKIQSG